MLQVLRDSAKHSIYALSHSNRINGLDSNTRTYRITPAWLQTLYGLDIAFGVLTVASVVVLTLSMFVFKKKAVKEDNQLRR